MIPDKRKRDIVAAFQRSFKYDNTSEIEAFTLDELRATDEMLGPRDQHAGYRIALRNRITDLEAEEQIARESRTRALHWIMIVITGLAVLAIAAMVGL